MKQSAVRLFAVLALCVVASVTCAQTTRPRLTWDRATLRFAASGGYARIVRLKDGQLILAYDHRGGCCIRRSADEGATWGDEICATQYAFGIAANAQPFVLADGTLWLLYNERPRDGKHSFTIRLTTSADVGQTWTLRDPPLYVAGEKFADGCWEPTAVQLASGEIWLLFANEGPYRTSNEQEITLIRSTDAGRTWTPPKAVSFRHGHRDGMPVPTLLADGSVVIAIEDDGLTGDGQFKPAIVRMDNERLPVGGDDARRWPAIEAPWRQGVYAGAPFLCRMPSGAVLLSCQSDEDGKPPRMAVHVGDADARHFGDKSYPFPTDAGKAGQWNSLFAKDAKTVTAVGSTTIAGRSGVWLIDGTFR